MRLTSVKVGVVNPLGIPGFQRPSWLPDLAPITASGPNIAMHLVVESHRHPHPLHRDTVDHRQPGAGKRLGIFFQGRELSYWK